ncbi:MAG: hypothetical protein LBK94_07805 [Prevotellaceae bacterium]|jgi:hypothetical protein|nr:hypothetical protein [Prevotellaceae bacterium]
MLYKEIEKLSSTQFTRLTGIKREIFEQMTEVLQEAKTHSEKTSKSRNAAQI